MPKVLIVEDDPDDAYFIQRAFVQSGVSHAPQVVNSLAEAIRYLEGSAEFADRKCFPFPNFLVSDIKMPGGSGFDLLRWIREHPDLRIIPTVIMSSSHLPEDVKAAYCLGANAYMCKPVEHDQFKEVFAALLRFWSFCEVPKTGLPMCEELVGRHK
jgi:CheY-like chemotaxis protein